MTAPADPWVGRILGGRYRLLQPLGSGGVGAVYDAEQIGLGRRVAVKLLRPELATDQVQLERFRREAKAAAQLGHPHIAQLFDFAEPAGGEPAYLVLELVHGRSLYALLRREAPLAPARAVALGSQILAALSTAHRAGIVHRDMKPGNVVVAEMPGLGEVSKILDFGIARIQESEAYQRLTRTGVIVGTPRYMSPEQASGRPLDGRSDLWSVGVILYAALTARFPFDGSPAEVVTAIVGKPVPPMGVAGVPPALEAAVARALEKQVERRWADADQMSAALRAALGEPSDQATGPMGRSPAPWAPAPDPTKSVDPAVLAAAARSAVPTGHVPAWPAAGSASSSGPIAAPIAPSPPWPSGPASSSGAIAPGLASVPPDPTRPAVPRQLGVPGASGAASPAPLASPVDSWTSGAARLPPGVAGPQEPTGPAVPWPPPSLASAPPTAPGMPLASAAPPTAPGMQLSPAAIVSTPPTAPGLPLVSPAVSAISPASPSYGSMPGGATQPPAQPSGLGRIPLWARAVAALAVLGGLGLVTFVVALGLTRSGGAAPGLGGVVPGLGGGTVVNAGDAPVRGTSSVFIADAVARATAIDPSARLGMISASGFSPSTGELDVGDLRGLTAVFVGASGAQFQLNYGAGLDAYPRRAEWEATRIVPFDTDVPDSAVIAAAALAACPALGRYDELVLSVTVLPGAGLTVTMSPMSGASNWMGRVGRTPGTLETYSSWQCF